MTYTFVGVAGRLAVFAHVVAITFKPTIVLVGCAAHAAKTEQLDVTRSRKKKGNAR